ncbi:MAG: hypothetical protein V3V32_04345 [Dehalococcoidia bacterium]
MAEQPTQIDRMVTLALELLAAGDYEAVRQGLEGIRQRARVVRLALARAWSSEPSSRRDVAVHFWLEQAERIIAEEVNDDHRE